MWTLEDITRGTEAYPPHRDQADFVFNMLLRAGIDRFPGGRVLEIGGGRRPYFTAEEMAQKKIRYAISDISPVELAAAPDWVEKIQSDIGAEAAFSPAYDILFSRSVLEHVRNTPQAWKNMHALLNEGGIALHQFPVLYNVPMLVNYILPARAARAILRLLCPQRDLTLRPHFKAYYRWCRATGTLEKRLKSLGYREVRILPLYLHDYFQFVPLLRHVSRGFGRLAARYDWRLFASAAIVIARK